jgi:hypothetical protein
MTGHESIVAMRRKGKRPAIVFVNDFPCWTDWEEFADHATVCVYRDAPALLDLRWAVGLTVSILADSEARAVAIADAFRESGAKTVVAGAVDKRAGYWDSTFVDFPEVEHA